MSTIPSRLVTERLGPGDDTQGAGLDGWDRRLRLRYLMTRTTAIHGRNPRSTSSNDRPSMFGCRSSSVAQPNQTSLINKPTTK